MRLHLLPALLLLGACEFHGLYALGLHPGDTVQGDVVLTTQDGVDALEGTKAIKPCDKANWVNACRGDLQLGRLKGMMVDNYGIPTTNTLEDVSALDSLEQVAGRVTLHGLDKVQRGVLGKQDGSGPALDVGDQLDVHGNRELENLDLLQGIRRVGGDLSITVNQGLTTTRGLDVRELTGSVTVADNPALVELAGLAQLAVIPGDLTITRNPALRSVKLLPPVVQVTGQVLIQDAPRLYLGDLVERLAAHPNVTLLDVGTAAYEPAECTPPVAAPAATACPASGLVRGGEKALYLAPDSQGVCNQLVAVQGREASPPVTLGMPQPSDAVRVVAADDAGHVCWAGTSGSITGLSCLQLGAVAAPIDAWSLPTTFAWVELAVAAGKVFLLTRTYLGETALYFAEVQTGATLQGPRIMDQDLDLVAVANGTTAVLFWEEVGAGVKRSENLGQTVTPVVANCGSGGCGLRQAGTGVMWRTTRLGVTELWSLGAADTPDHAVRRYTGPSPSSEFPGGSVTAYGGDATDVLVVLTTGADSRLLHGVGDGYPRQWATWNQGAAGSTVLLTSTAVSWFQGSPPALHTMPRCPE